MALRLFTFLLLATVPAFARLLGDNTTWTPVKRVSCEECIDLFTYADTVIASHENLIEAVVCDICDELPEESAQKCKTLAMASVPVVISNLVTMFPPEKVCETLELCDAPRWWPFSRW